MVIAGGWIAASIFLILQSTLMRLLPMGGAVPDLAFAILLWLSYNTSGAQGSVAAFLAGFSGDFISSSPLGYHAFLYSMASWFAAALARTVRIDGVILPILFGASGTLVKFLAGSMLSALLGGERILGGSILDTRLWIQVGLNAALTPIVFYGLAPVKRMLSSRGWLR